MCNSQYCEVEYKSQYNVVLVKWKKFCSYDDYRKPLEYALQIINRKENPIWNTFTSEK